MNRLAKRSFFALLAFVALAGVTAQAKASSKTVTIQIVAVVPAVLRLSLDFSTDATVQVAGYIPGTEVNAIPASYSREAKPRFEIKSGAKVDLGNARLFSNVSSSYSINVYSANGGTLRDANDVSSVAIPYQLQFGDAAADARGGSFSFNASGKSTKGGEPLMVALAINSVLTAAKSGTYTDQLMFAVSAN